jgi:hypothetical protein
MMDHESDPLRPHSHEPNFEPPREEPEIVLALPGSEDRVLRLEELWSLPLATASDCYIVSTGHGTSGPFAFGGVRLLDLIESHMTSSWTEVEVISADGFGNRISREELLAPDPAGPVLLSYLIDGAPMTRRQGLVRLIVPSERDDALRQVKWVACINVVP